MVYHMFPLPSQVEEEVIRLNERSEDHLFDFLDYSTTILRLRNRRLGFLLPFPANHASCNFTVSKVTVGDHHYLADRH